MISMGNMQKSLRAAALLLALVLVFGLLAAAGCGRTPSDNGAGLKIVATVFPAYDFVRELLKGVPGAEVTLLLKPGTESHTFDPSVSDALAVSACDLFVYAGGDADLWVDKFLNADNSLAARSLSLLSAASDTLLIEGEDEEDPHVWTSPRHAMELVRALCDKLTALPAAAEHVDAITANRDAYLEALTALDNDFRTLAASLPAEKRILAFGDRYPFRYFCAEYGFTACAVFPGCAEESEPAAADVKRVVDLIREHGLSTVYYVELSNHRIADAIAAETGANTACLHSCHNLSREDFDAGETYLSLMRRNYAVLQQLIAS